MVNSTWETGPGPKVKARKWSEYTVMVDDMAEEMRIRYSLPRRGGMYYSTYVLTYPKVSSDRPLT